MNALSSYLPLFFLYLLIGRLTLATYTYIEQRFDLHPHSRKHNTSIILLWWVAIACFIFGLCIGAYEAIRNDGDE